MAEAEKIIKNVRLMSKDFVNGDMPVSLVYNKVENLANTMLIEGKTAFNVEDTSDLPHAATILIELFADAINYCFWYGKYNFVPMKNNSSVSMFDVIINAAKNNFKGIVDSDFLNVIVDRLTFDSYPLLEERIKHLLEVSMGTQEFVMFVLMNKQNNVRIVLHELIRRYPGFASDMFKKRAFLFVISLNRKLGFFKDTINDIPVPADYQVPKMLEYFKCLRYSNSLKQKINNHVMIPKYSIEEISIRAGTIMVCDRLKDLTGWTSAEIDAWLWLRRKECDKPFHLTITTDY